MDQKIGFAGMSHLGLVSSIATAAKGFHVVSFDGRADLVRDLQMGKLPVHEPDLDDLLKRHASNITFTNSGRNLASCAVVILSIDIPTNQNNESDLSALDRLADSVVTDLADDTVLVVLSQVRPGYTRQLARRLETILTAKRIQLYYQVETLIFGRAVERALHPERFIVGCADPGQPLPATIRKTADAVRMSDPADALRKCRVGQDRYQYLPDRVRDGHEYPRQSL